MTLYRRLLAYLHPYRLRLLAAILCSGAVAALSGAYAYLVKPVLDGLFISKDETLLLVLPLAILGVAVLKGAFSYGQNYLMNYVGYRVVTDVRQQLFEKIVRLPVSYHDTNNSGHIAARVVNDVSAMNNAVSGVLKDLVQQGLTFLAMMGVIFYQDWRLASMSLLVIPLAGGTMATMGKRLRRIANRGLEQFGEMTTSLHEILGGIRIIKAFNREALAAQRFRRDNWAVLGTWMKSIQISSLGSAHMEVIGVLGVAGIIWYGGYLVIHGDMTPGAFFSFLTAMFMAYTPIRKLSGANGIIQQALAAAERVFLVLDLEDEYQQNHGTVEMPRIQRAVEFRQVTVTYPGHTLSALEDVSLTVGVGEVVALVGSSGSGKSTLVSLVPRFYDVTQGAVLIDGRDSRTFRLDSLRNQIGIVSQDVVLFDDTVASNIAYGRAGATEAEIEQASKAAYAHEFIARLPEGYQTRIGEHGVKLSGGERQRLAIARAILRDPPILILDEATSALDTESERVVQVALANVMKHRTTLVVAHRLSTIQKADRIVVMSRGRVVEIGTHEQLLQRNGAYQRLHSLQFHDAPSESADAADVG